MFEFENRDADHTEHALLLYGIVDGGGGPGRKHIERLKRTENVEDLPKVSMSFGLTPLSTSTRSPGRSQGNCQIIRRFGQR